MRLHHIGIITEDIERSILSHRTLFGLEPITEIVEDPIQQVSVVLLSPPEGGVPIELIAPLADGSPISNLLKKGVRLYQLCYSVRDIDETLNEVRSKNAIIISKPSPAMIFGGRRVAFVYMPDGYIVEFLEEER
jgi:methylmalonyl-CoA/ethylmalonyl-CoA epimerase